MTFGMKNTKTVLDPKQCFDLWIETGSVYKARLVLKSKYGIVNPETGKLITAMGLWDAAWRYVLENMVEARKSVEQTWRANGQLLSDAEWYKIVTKRAVYLYSPSKLEKFLARHEYLRPYLYAKE
jgi:hypothetical protein